MFLDDDIYGPYELDDGSDETVFDFYPDSDYDNWQPYPPVTTTTPSPITTTTTSPVILTTTSIPVFENPNQIPENTSTIPEITTASPVTTGSNVISTTTSTSTIITTEATTINIQTETSNKSAIETGIKQKDGEFLNIY